MNVVIRNLPDNTSEEEIGELLREFSDPRANELCINEGLNNIPISIQVIDVKI